MEPVINMHYVVNSLVFSGVGIAVLVVCYVLLDVITPKVRIWSELVEQRNMALAVFLGSIVIGLSLIISSAIHG